jgi:GGDEF domain-containing protein
VNERSVAVGVGLGAAGLIAAVVATVTGIAAIGLVAGVAAVAAAAWAVQLASRSEQAREFPGVHASAEPAGDGEAQPPAVAEPLRGQGYSPDDIAAMEARGEFGSGDEGGKAPEWADSLMDPETGLLNERYYRVALEARVSAARRHLRPVAVVLVEVIEGLTEAAPRSADPAVVAAAVNETLREADTACRLPNGRFGLLLEDTPENGAVWTVERLRRSLVPGHPGFTMWAGVACYPAHAFSPEELFDRASQALESAREWRQDRIEVATAE